MDFEEKNINEETVTDVTEEDTQAIFQEEIPEDIEQDLVGSESDDEITQTEEKHKGIFKYINPCVFVALCIVVAAFLVFAVYKIFFVNSIAGTWEFKTSSVTQNASGDEVEQKVSMYYEFEEPDAQGIGTVHIYDSGLESKTSYSIATDEETGKKIINIGEGSTTDLYYVIEGNKLFGNAELKITMPASTDPTTGQKIEEETIEMKQADKPKFLENSFKEYNTDDKIIGKWENSSRVANYYGMYQAQFKQTIEFTDDGVMKISYDCPDFGMSDVTIYYSYTVKNNEITIQRATDSKKQKAKFKVKGDKITFTDNTKDGAAIGYVYFGRIFDDISYYKSGSKAAKTASAETTVPETTVVENTTKAK